VQNSIIVITGASAGIGAALAEVVHARGAVPVLAARRQDRLADVALRSGNALTLVADVTSRAAVQQVVRDVLAAHGRIDVWVNNVGQGISRPPSELTDEDIDQVMRVNVMSALYGMQEVLPHFKARGRGHIVNVSSMLGRIPFATFRSAYCAAKHFLNALTTTFRAEVQATHPEIQISLVSPGVVRTEFGVNALHGGPDSRQLPHSQSAEEVATVIADVIASRRADVYTRAGAAAQIASYYATLGEDPSRA
jgi:NADP-dependent 3-hydroxy acid dehydrogenase YdfG